MNLLLLRIDLLPIILVAPPGKEMYGLIGDLRSSIKVKKYRLEVINLKHCYTKSGIR